MRLILTFTLLCSLFMPHGSWAQKDASISSIWYFGEFAGLDFRTTPPTPLTDGKLVSLLGASSICDGEGNLLFYTDGIQVWNRHHAVMPNGTGLRGKGFSSTSPTVIVPHPGSSNRYYIFTINPSDGRPIPVGFSYAIVNLSLEAGLGAVTAKQIPLANPTADVLTAVRHANGKDVWVIAHGYNNQDYYAYLVTEAGVSPTPIISQIGSTYRGGFGKQMKASPDGSLVAVTLSDESDSTGATCQNKIEVFRFNSATGQLFERLLSGVCNGPGVFQKIQNPYGLEFSPNGLLLYFLNVDLANNIFQLDLTAGSEAAILASALPVTSWVSVSQKLMQLGPDGRVYIAHGGGSDYDWLSVIEHPNVRGKDCGYKEDGVHLAEQRSTMALPIFIQSSFSEPANLLVENSCLGDTTVFIPSSLGSTDSIRWNFGEVASGVLNTSSLAKPSHSYRQPGRYEVTLTAYIAGLVRQIIRTVEIHSKPLLSLGADTTICSGESIRLTGGDWATYRWSTGESSPAIQVSQEGVYWLEVSNGACSSVDTIRVSVLPSPTQALSEDVFTCAASLIRLDAGNPGCQYKWSTGANSQTIDVGQSGLYWVRVRNGNCYQDDTIRVSFAGVYDWVAGAEKDSLAYQQEAAFFATGTGLESWQWDFGDGTQAFSTNPRHTFLEEGHYTVTVTAENNSNCRVSKTLSVYQQPYLFIPNIFTPNFDGKNDLFAVDYNGKAPYELKIFNRWGKEVFMSENKHLFWDGTHAVTGLYYYHLRVGTSHYQGWIELLR